MIKEDKRFVKASREVLLAFYVGDEARVYGKARVFDDALVYGDAQVYDYAQVYEDAQVFDNTEVCDDVQVCGNVVVYGDATVCGNPRLESTDDYLTIGPLGSEGGTLTAFRTANGSVLCTKGCFLGPLEELGRMVRERHGDDRYGREYGLAIQLIRERFELKLITDTV